MLARSCRWRRPRAGAGVLDAERVVRVGVLGQGAGGARMLAVVQVESILGPGTSWDVSWCRDGVVGKYAIHGSDS